MENTKRVRAIGIDRTIQDVTPADVDAILLVPGITYAIARYDADTITIHGRDAQYSTAEDVLSGLAAHGITAEIEPT